MRVMASILAAGFIGLCISYSSGAAAADSGPDSEKLILHFAFEEGSGETAGDSSPSRNHGKLSGGVEWVEGKTGYALEFDGDNYLSAENLYDEMSEFTVSFWIWQPASEELGMCILGNSRNHGLGAAGFYFLKRHSEEGNIQFRVSDGEAGRLINNNGLPVGEWAHVAGTLKDGTMNLYINGTRVGRTTGVEHTGVAESPFMAGSNENGRETALPGMRIDEIRVWRRALEESEIELLSRGDKTE